MERKFPSPGVWGVGSRQVLVPFVAGLRMWLQSGPVVPDKASGASMRTEAGFILSLGKFEKFQSITASVPRP